MFPFILVAMCIHYEWRQVVIFTRDTGTCEFGARIMMESLRKIGVIVAEWIRSPDDDDDVTDAMLIDYLQRIKSRARSMNSFLYILFILSSFILSYAAILCG